MQGRVWGMALGVSRVGGGCWGYKVDGALMGAQVGLWVVGTGILFLTYLHIFLHFVSVV
jgi:hypothetical protein